MPNLSWSCLPAITKNNSPIIEIPQMSSLNERSFSDRPGDALLPKITRSRLSTARQANSTELEDYWFANYRRDKDGQITIFFKLKKNGRLCLKSIIL